MMKNFFYSAAITFVLTALCPALSTGQQHTFSLGDSTFLLDGKSFQIIAGELHYVRIPDAYWKDRLHKAKAMGLNTVAVYCMWNMHEPEPGKWIFSGNEDVAHFIKLAQQEGLWVILRPGPYVCAEWEFGGYPWWLLKEKDLQVRSRDPRFMQAAHDYLMQLGKQLAPLQITNGGPILMVQVENEYGSFGNDTTYERQIARDIREAGFHVPLFTADGDWLFKNAALPGILPGANGESNPAKLKKLVNEFHDGKGPYFVPELYPGWLDHWGEKFVQVPADKVIEETKRLLDAGASISFYMWHGGTNFGFMSGANYNDKQPIQPDITSYDYDAPLSEAGVPTDKYMALRKLIMNDLPASARAAVPPVPPAPAFISIPDIQLKQSASLFDNLPDPVHNDHPLSMEDMNQGYGYALYRTTLSREENGLLKIKGLRDYAEIFIDGKRVGILNRMYKQDSMEINAPAGSRLDILVENLGRINYGREMIHNRKGIIGEVTINDRTLTGWDMYTLPFKHTRGIHFAANEKIMQAPVIYKGIFRLNKTGDTFIDLREWGKGIVFVNDHNLGRYWNLGPQQTLYLPGCWLKKGKNEIVIFEQLKHGKTVVSTIDHPILDQLKK
jgi:beta-galactosidase